MPYVQVVVCTYIYVQKGGGMRMKEYNNLFFYLSIVYSIFVYIFNFTFKSIFMTQTPILYNALFVQSHSILIGFLIYYV